MSGLKRVGQLLCAVEDGDDVDAVGLDAIDQTIGIRDQFTQALIIVLGHDAPGAWMVDQLLDAPRELVDGLGRIERRIAFDEVVNAAMPRGAPWSRPPRQPSFRQAVLGTDRLVVGDAIGVAVGKPPLDRLALVKLAHHVVVGRVVGELVNQLVATCLRLVLGMSCLIRC